MNRSSCAIAVVALLLFSACAAAQSGRLQQVRNDANSSTSSSGSGSDSGSSSDGGIVSSILGGLFSASDENGNSLGGAMALATFAAPFYIPVAVLNDDYKYHLYFVPYPYANDYRGYQILAPELGEMFYDTDTKELPRKSWAVRISVEDGNDFNGLNRLNGQLKVEHESRWGIVSNWNWFRERLSDGSYDATLIGDTNLTFRFAQNEIASMYTGLGFRVLTDRHTNDWGFNFTYGGDWFPIRPLVVSGVFDAGTLGSAGVVHVRGSVGAIFHGWEVFAGYDLMRINSVNLQGPMAGVRWWF